MAMRILQRPLIATLPLLLAACGSLSPDRQAYWAVGQEPFWQITVQDEVLVLRTPDQPVGEPIAVRHQAVGNGARWQGRHRGQDFRFEVRTGTCHDAMSGVRFTHTAAWQSGSRQATGCAVSGTQAPPWRDGEAP